ncbi:hypothetical protein [Peterkaempfera bronchialis]|uniref:Uncharacterized protein n=1 Tax=Peterkaempfera bronchialis TaxID=2126346 RepID=A0A345T354_9ACTN|nr:hypothetical protein [Peterkaempfera bronchialis]AXI80409.1 hypothetical protein C7M71_026425 [Peterkaempfera bronchialis]
MNLLHAGQTRHRVRPVPTLPAGTEEVLAVVADPQRPVHLVVTAGRAACRRFVSWQPWDPVTRTGNCYHALSAPVCDALLEAGLITLGPVVQDPQRQVQTIGLTETGRCCWARPAVHAA